MGLHLSARGWEAQGFLGYVPPRSGVPRCQKKTLTGTKTCHFMLFFYTPLLACAEEILILARSPVSSLHLALFYFALFITGSCTAHVFDVFLFMHRDEKVQVIGACLEVGVGDLWPLSLFPLHWGRVSLWESPHQVNYLEDQLWLVPKEGGS